MNRILFTLAAATLILNAPEARSQEENSLTRDEVAIIKKKLVNVLDALGQAPAGYSVENENFNLPTEVYKIQPGGLYGLLSGSVSRRYGTEKKTQNASGDLSKEYQKKILEAQAKGDYEAMTKLSMEMQKKMSEAQLQAVEGHKEPIDLSIWFNSNPNVPIDPDAVLFERAGALALKAKDNNSPEKSKITVYCDPISLKDTKQLSKVTLKQPEAGVSRKTTVLNITIDLAGPTTEIEAWAKKFDIKKVLVQIDAAK
jgi:hypothetical protein